MGTPQESPVDAKFVLDHLQSPDMVLVDARANDRYHGQNETIDPIGGHIPGARNRFFKDNLTPQGFFKSPEQLRYFEVTGGQRATMAVLYFGLAGLLAAGMFAAKVAITALDLR